MTRIEFAAPTRWINANSRMHWSKRAQMTRTWRAVTHWQALRLLVGPHGRSHVTITFHPADNRLGEVANLAPTAKAIVDGLVDAGVFPDDRDRFVVGPDLRRGVADGPRVVIEIEELT